MTPKSVISLVKSYFLTLAGSGLSLITIYFLFNDIITIESEGIFAYFIIGTLMTLFAPIGIAIFFLFPITLIEEKRIDNTGSSDLIKRYTPLPVFILSFIFSLFILLNDENAETICIVSVFFLQAYSIAIIQLTTYIKQLKS